MLEEKKNVSFVLFGHGFDIKRNDFIHNVCLAKLNYPLHQHLRSLQSLEYWLVSQLSPVQSPHFSIISNHFLLFLPPIVIYYFLISWLVFIMNKKIIALPSNLSYFFPNHSLGPVSGMQNNLFWKAESRKRRKESSQVIIFASSIIRATRMLRMGGKGGRRNGMWKMEK